MPPAGSLANLGQGGTMTASVDHRGRNSRFLPVTERVARLPFWLLAAVLLALLFLWVVANDGDYQVIFLATLRGVGTTVYVTVIAYTMATLLGLLVGLLRISGKRVIQEVATFYIEIVRGIPMLVVLYYIAFVGAPAFVDGANWLGRPLISAGIIEPMSVRHLNFTVRAILALSIGYSAFIAEIFRAGIESIDRGQTEAALAVGMSRLQALRFVVLPQAVRVVLPPLGNDFVAMLKDSALVSVLGVQDITQLGKVYSASTFKFFETYNVVAFLYLVMTVGLSMLVGVLERRLSRHRK
ncbi:amino acid ABC transporter permease [Chloroflexota bacterium]